MGELIDLSAVRARRAAQATAVVARPEFFFDVSCPLSYLVAERVERRLGEVDWVPVDRRGLHLGEHPAPGIDARLCARAESSARSLRLPLVWPDGFPKPTPRAQRAAAFASEVGAGGAFALAASRLAFCGGFDLEDPETLAEAAAASGVPLEECLLAARETWRDEELAATARALAQAGVSELPAVRIGTRWLHGDSGLLVAEALLNESDDRRRSLGPR